MHIGGETWLLIGAVAASIVINYFFLWTLQYNLEGESATGRGAAARAFDQFDRRFETVFELLQMQRNEEEGTRSRCHIIEEQCLTMLSEIRTLSLQCSQLERDMTAVASSLDHVSDRVYEIIRKLDV